MPNHVFASASMSIACNARSASRRRARGSSHLSKFVECDVFLSPALGDHAAQIADGAATTRLPLNGGVQQALGSCVAVGAKAGHVGERLTKVDPA